MIIVYVLAGIVTLGFVYFAVVRELVSREAVSLEESRGVLVSGLRARQLAREINEKQVQL